MNLSRIFNEIQLSPQSKTMVDLLKLNEKTKEYGLVLKPNDVKIWWFREIKFSMTMHELNWELKC